MNKDKTLESSLLDMVEEGVLQQSTEDLKEQYKSNNLQDTADYQKTKTLVNSALSQYKKSKLINAREQLNRQKKSTGFIEGKKFGDVKEKLINLISNGKMPEGLTMAFHKGGDIPDDEIESIIQDLKDLGIDIDDE